MLPQILLRCSPDFVLGQTAYSLQASSGMWTTAEVFQLYVHSALDVRGEWMVAPFSFMKSELVRSVVRSVEQASGLVSDGLCHFAIAKLKQRLDDGKNEADNCEISAKSATSGAGGCHPEGKA